MVAPLAPQPNMPPPGPPMQPQGGPAAAGPPPGLNPQTAQVIAGIAQNTGVPPQLVLRFLTFTLERLPQQAGDQAVSDFLHLPPDRQRAVLLAWAQSQGIQSPSPGAPSPAGGTPPPPPTQGGPPPQGGPPIQMGPGGPGGPPPGAAPMPTHPPQPSPMMDQTPPRAQRVPDAERQQKAKEPKVIPWRPPDIAAIRKRAAWKDSPFTWDEVQERAELALKYWQPRQAMIAEQQRVIYRRPIFEAADGTPLNPAEGEVMFLRSKPARDFERYCSLAEPTRERIRRQMKPRVRAQKVVNAAQLVENVLRDLDRRDEAAWLDRASMGDPQPPLSYKDIYLTGAQGGIAWEYKWNDGSDQQTHPYKRQAIPWSEIFPMGNLTLRITRLPLAEARAQYDEIRELFPPRDDKDRPPEYPSDDAKVRVIGAADVWGLWWGLAWDFEEGPLKRQKDGKRERWIVEPQPIDYGFPYYRYLLPRATGAPALDDDQDERIRHTARGVLADRLGDVRMQDQMTSAMATGAIKAIDPPVTLYLDGERRERDENNVIVPPKVDRGIGGKTYLLDNEKLEQGDVPFSASRDVANMLGMLGSDDNDASPAVLAGRDAAPSGFARALGSEAAAALYVDPLQRAMITMREMIDADRCTLLWRALSGDDPLLTGLVVAGNDGEVELTAKHLELAGNETTITYRDTNMATRMQLTDLFLRLKKEGAMDIMTMLDELGFEEPELIQRAVLKDQALELPPFREALIEREIEDTGDEFLIGAFQRGLARVQGPPPAEKGLPSPPGGAPGPQPMPGGSATPPQMMGG